MSRRRRNQRIAKQEAAALAATAAAREAALLLEPVPATTVLVKLLPEITLVVIALAFALVPRLQTPEMRGILDATVFLEFAFCLAQGTLTDLATRLRKPPPAALGIALAVGAGLVLLGNTRDFLDLSRELGWVMFLGILWSGAERLREIWTMPNASRAEKLRRRALVGGRIELVLAGGAVTMLIVGTTYLLDDTNGGFRAQQGGNRRLRA